MTRDELALRFFTAMVVRQGMKVDRPRMREWYRLSYRIADWYLGLTPPDPTPSP